MSIKNGSQWGEKLEHIRDDHLVRYRHAATLFSNKKVIDAACGVGYGSSILQHSGCTVDAYDISGEAIAHARVYFQGAGTVYHHANLYDVVFPKSDVAISFETIEHLDHPRGFLIRLRQAVKELIGSVPNEDVNPFNKSGHKWHARHYTPNEIHTLLVSAGWTVTGMMSQHGKRRKAAEIQNNTDGMTLVFTAI